MFRKTLSRILLTGFVCGLVIGCNDSSDCFLIKIVDEEVADIYFYYERSRLKSVEIIQTWTTPQTPSSARLVYGQDGKVDTVYYNDPGTYGIFSYDAAGRLIEVTTNIDRTSTYAYNTSGQLVSQVLKSSGGETLFEYFYPNTQTTNYDSMRTSDSSGYGYITTYSYDSHPNPLFGIVTYYMSWFSYGELHTENNVLARQGSPGHQTFVYEYDMVGFPTKMTSNSGRVRTFTRVCQ